MIFPRFKLFCVSTFKKQFYLSFHVSKETFLNLIRKKNKIQIMPKDRQHCLALKEMRLKNKNLSKKSRFPPCEIYLSVLGNGSTSSSRALYMFTDHERYLFNCGEGTQRLAQEHKMKLAKLNHIFITHKSWDNLGGLLGQSLTIQEMGVPEMTLHGPPGIDELVKESSSFVILQEMNVVTKNIEEPFRDDCIQVDYIPIFNKSCPSEVSSHSSDSESEHYSSSDSDNQKQKSKKIRLSKKVHPPDVTVAFACKGHSKPGQLLLDKCADQGVPVGPLLGELKNGKDVTLPSGKVVMSKDVVSPEQVCPIFLVVECPSEKFLEPFVNEEKFHLFQSNHNDPSGEAVLVVHFTPAEILKSQKYQEWINRFPETTCHLILNNENSTLNSLGIHRIQHQLNLLHPTIFPLLQENDTTYNRRPENIIQVQTLERFYLRPSTGLDRSFALKIQPTEFIGEAMKAKEFELRMKELHNTIQVHSTLHVDEGIYPQVVFLGTGSSLPCKSRNVSAILVNTSKHKYLLMDCGEGTYGQLHRLFGTQHKDVLLQLFCVFISHIHADHHLGLIKLLQEREKLFKELQKKPRPLLLIAPKKLYWWLKACNKLFRGLSSQYRFAECTTLEHDELFHSHGKNEIESGWHISVSTVPVNHCHDAHGIILSSKSPEWKLVYSGDTTPCERLVSAGKNCSLLIHEATMEDELSADAALKKHSTTGEAIKIAEEMAAKYTILTHFSQRYARVPLFNDNFHNRIGCAFDNMKVRPNELYILPLLIPALNALFADHVEELHVRGNKRRQKIQLMKTLLANSVSQDSMEANAQ